MADNTNKLAVDLKNDIAIKYQTKMMQAHGVGLVGSGIQSIAGGFMAGNQYDYDAFLNTTNAASARANANMVARSRNVGISEAKEAGSKFISTQINQMAQSGALVGGAGTADIISESDFLIQREISTMKLERDLELAEAEKQAGFLESQAAYDKKMASSARTAGILNGISSIMSAAGTFANAKTLGYEDMGGTKTKGTNADGGLNSLHTKPSVKPLYRG